MTTGRFSSPAPSAFCPLPLRSPFSRTSFETVSTLRRALLIRRSSAVLCWLVVIFGNLVSLRKPLLSQRPDHLKGLRCRLREDRRPGIPEQLELGLTHRVCTALTGSCLASAIFQS